MPRSTITAKGQTTIPKAIREQLGVDVGDRLDFFIRPDGTVVLEPATFQVAELKGLLAAKGQRPVTVDAMHKAIRARLSKP
jgi:AbrB family looped-hinge helix DNA binding protein